MMFYRLNLGLSDISLNHGPLIESYTSNLPLFPPPDPLSFSLPKATKAAIRLHHSLRRSAFCPSHWKAKAAPAGAVEASGGSLLLPLSFSCGATRRARGMHRVDWWCHPQESGLESARAGFCTFGEWKDRTWGPSQGSYKDCTPNLKFYTWAYSG